MTVDEMREYIAYSSETKQACFSEDGQYRFFLKRQPMPALGQNLRGICMFIGANPSVAGETRNDLTITKETKWAGIWGYAEMWMLNLRAAVGTDPKSLEGLHDSIGEYNDLWIAECAKYADRIVCAYGDLGKLGNRARVVEEALLIAEHGNKMVCFGLTNAGLPKHPSRIAYSTPLRTYGGCRVEEQETP